MQGGRTENLPSVVPARLLAALRVCPGAGERPASGSRDRAWTKAWNKAGSRVQSRDWKAAAGAENSGGTWAADAGSQRPESGRRAADQPGTSKAAAGQEL
jgi:hypothetical protein